MRLIRLRERRLRLKNSLVKYGFIKILELEFNIYLKEHETEKIELAETCIEIYDSVEEFYEATGWKRDNPETANLEYLLKHRVLVEIQGKMWYFSRIRYEDGLKKLEEQNCT